MYQSIKVQTVGNTNLGLNKICMLYFVHLCSHVQTYHSWKLNYFIAKVKLYILFIRVLLFLLFVLVTLIFCGRHCYLIMCS